MWDVYQIFVLLFFFQSSLQKNQITKELEEQKQKLLRAEQNLQACQNKEHDVRKKMEVGLPKSKVPFERKCYTTYAFFFFFHSVLPLQLQ